MTKDLVSRNGTLPQNYKAAQRELAQLTRTDECQRWADKARALASYALQAKDQSLFQYAQRVQARAIRRGGELFQKIKPAKNQHDARTGTGTSRKEAAAAAGVSKRQKDTMLRVASVPDADFERQVESEKPPTVTELARQGTKVIDFRGRSTTNQFKAATQALAKIEEFAAFAQAHDAIEVAKGVGVKEFARAQRHLKIVETWLLLFGSTLQLEEETCAKSQ